MTSCEFDEKQATKPKFVAQSRPGLYFSQHQLIAQGEKRETSTRTCNETMLHDMLRLFVSRISPPLVSKETLVQHQCGSEILELSTKQAERGKFLP